MSAESKEKSMMVRGMADLVALNRLFSKRLLLSDPDVQNRLADAYIERCRPEIGKRLWGVVTYISSEGASPHYGVQLDDESNTVVYCKKNGTNIGDFLDSIAEISGDGSRKWYAEHPEFMSEYKAKLSEMARNYLLWKPEIGCEVQILIVGYDEEFSVYFGVLELDVKSV